MKKEVVHKVVVHNFVNLIEKSHKIDSLSIFSPLFVCVASSFYTHICQSIRQTQKRTKPSYTSGWHYSLFYVAAAYCNSTFPLCHLLRESCLLDVQCQCLHLFVIVLVRLNWSFLFFHVSTNVLSVIAHVDDKYLQWFCPFSRYGCFDNYLILRGVRFP